MGAVMDKLHYGIKSGGVLIAAFLVEYDRDRYIDVLKDEFDDCAFKVVEIE